MRVEREVKGRETEGSTIISVELINSLGIITSLDIFTSFGVSISLITSLVRKETITRLVSDSGNVTVMFPGEDIFTVQSANYY